MPLFVISCIDKPDSLSVRMAARDAHLAYANTGEKPVKVKLGGPYLDGRGNMAGSLLLLDAPDRSPGGQFFRDDPYVTPGLFESVDVPPHRATVGPPPG